MEKDDLAKSSDISIEKEGLISQSLTKDGIPNQSLPDDHIGIENISVEPNKLYEAVSALRNYGFNYLQCQGGYDEGPGKNLVSFYHFITVDDLQKIKNINLYTFFIRTKRGVESYIHHAIVFISFKKAKNKINTILRYYFVFFNYINIGCWKSNRFSNRFSFYNNTIYTKIIS